MKKVIILFSLLFTVAFSATEKAVVFKFSGGDLSDEKLTLFTSLFERLIFETRVYQVVGLEELAAASLDPACDTYDCISKICSKMSSRIAIRCRITKLGKAYIFLFDVIDPVKKLKISTHTESSDNLDNVLDVLKKSANAICGFNSDYSERDAWRKGTASRADKRHFGVNFGGGPAVLSVDFDYGRLNAFFSGSLLLPFLDYIGFMAGAGPSFKISPHWRFDIYGTLAVYGDFYSYDYYYSSYGSDPEVYVAPGIAFGFHFTTDSGFTMGFKIPFFGLAIWKGNWSKEMSLAYYYLSFAASAPSMTVGYRF